SKATECRWSSRRRFAPRQIRTTPNISRRRRKSSGISSELWTRLSRPNMSTLIPPRPRQVGLTRQVGIRRRFALVASQFNQQYVQGLVNYATQELRALVPSVVIDLYQVPGAFEIPIVARELARQKKADAILALAVILQGKTD